MGASGWSYFVPYQEDAARALEQLQHRVFVEENYSDTWLYDCIPNIYWDDLNKVWGNLHRSWVQAAGYERSWQGFAQAGLEELARVLAAKQIDVVLPKPPQTIEELLLRYDSGGTHSILDIISIAEQPGFRMATSLSREECLTLLGTEKPTRARAELALTVCGKPGEKSLHDIRGR